MCDKLQAQGKLEYTTRPTPFAYPVFVVWKTVPAPDGKMEEKPRGVVDIRGLNKMSIPDSYQIPLQSDLFAGLIGC